MGQPSQVAGSSHSWRARELQSSKSYTRQSADLLWQPIELETLDILAMVHDVIADRVNLHNKLRQAVFLLWQSASVAANASIR